MIIHTEKTYPDSVYVSGQYDEMEFSFNFLFADGNFRFGENKLTTHERRLVEDSWKKRYFFAYQVEEAIA